MPVLPPALLRRRDTSATADEVTGEPATSDPVAAAAAATPASRSARIDAEPAPRRRLLPRRRVLVAEGAALALLLGGGGIAWVATGKTVTLTVDGESQQVDTRADTVEAVLAQAGYQADPRDVLAPAAGSELDDGATVVLRRARQVQLSLDGRQSDVWVTAADVDEALDQIGVLDDRSFVSADRSRDIGLDGIALTVRTPKQITLVDGAAPPLSVTSTAPDVSAVLAQQGKAVDADDRVSVPVDDALAPGMQVVVTRVVTGLGVEQVPLPVETVRDEDASLARGETAVASEGQPGLLERDVAWRDENGVRVETTVVGERVVRPAEPRVVKVGTRAPAPAPTRSASSGTSSASGSGGGGSVDGSLNWSALARCESGGNPRAVNGSGKYRGLYQFDLTTWRSVGGSGDPIDASSAEQTSRAQALYDRRGRAPWPECGRHL